LRDKPFRGDANLKIRPKPGTNTEVIAGVAVAGLFGVVFIAPELVSPYENSPANLLYNHNWQDESYYDMILDTGVLSVPVAAKWIMEMAINQSSRSITPRRTTFANLR